MIKLGNFPRLELKSQEKALIGQIKLFLMKKWLKKGGMSIFLFPEAEKWLKLTGFNIASSNKEGL